jgi:hypothetical protein
MDFVGRAFDEFEKLVAKQVSVLTWLEATPG